MDAQAFGQIFEGAVKTFGCLVNALVLLLIWLLASIGIIIYSLVTR